MAAKKSAFAPGPQETKLAQTDRAARAIIGAEDEARRAKTERLRVARLKKEAAEAKAEAAAKPAKAKTPKRRVKA